MSVHNRLVIALLAVFATPSAVIFAIGLTVIGGAAAGIHPFWPTPDLNISEYAAVIDTADVVRLIRSGTDPNGAFHVRPEFLRDWYNPYFDSAFKQAGMTLFDTDGMYTPLHVAVIVRQPGLVRILIGGGAVLSGGTRAAAICFAELNDDSSIVRSLMPTGDGTDPRASCPPPVVEP